MINSYEDLNKYLSQINAFISKEEGKREKIQEQIDNTKKALDNIQDEIDLLEKVNILFQKTSEFARNQAKFQIESLVTNCLQYVFENDIEFKIEIEELRNKPSADFYVITKENGTTIKTKPELSRGGGVVDIISLALRIAFLQIHKPKIQGPLILDEPAKHVSEDYIFNVADFLKKTSEMFERQIIIVTHNNHLSAIGTNAYRVTLKGTISEVSKVLID
ncbi:MAG: ATPase [Tissierellia bacterium]|nr:ATPase [Tissierellia bacterium]